MLNYLVITHVLQHKSCWSTCVITRKVDLVITAIIPPFFSQTAFDNTETAFYYVADAYLRTEPLALTDPPSVLVTCQSNCGDRIDLSQNLVLMVNVDSITIGSDVMADYFFFCVCRKTSILLSLFLQYLTAAVCGGGVWLVHQLQFCYFTLTNKLLLWLQVLLNSDSP